MIMEMNYKLMEKLRRLGLPPHMRGTWYIHDAALMWYPGAFLTKEVYPQVAHEHGVTWVAVERCVRSAIQYAWDHKRGYTTDIVGLLGMAGIAIKPAAAELVAALALWMGEEATRN